MIEINGQKYLNRSDKACDTCLAAKRYMYIKMITASKDVVLECVACSNIITVSESSVKAVPNE